MKTLQELKNKKAEKIKEVEKEYISDLEKAIQIQEEIIENLQKLEKPKRKYNKKQKATEEDVDNFIENL